MTEEELINKFESENITLAPFSKRAMAFVIDEIMVYVLIILAFWNDFAMVEGNAEQILQLSARLIFYVYLLKLIYHGFFVKIYGATLGKIAMKIRVIELLDGDTPNYSVSFARSFVRIVSEYAFYIGFFWALQNSKRQTWHDIASKTLVINA